MKIQNLVLMALTGATFATAGVNVDLQLGNPYPYGYRDREYLCRHDWRYCHDRRREVVVVQQPVVAPPPQQVIVVQQPAQPAQPVVPPAPPQPSRSMNSVEY
jgi:hypothetical protein